MACQTDGAWIWLELADTVNEDINVHYASEKRPRGIRQKFTKAQVVNGEVLIEKWSFNGRSRGWEKIRKQVLKGPEQMYRTI